MPKLSDTREVILDYWYTTAQMRDVGTAWERAGSNRLFLSSEVVDESGHLLFQAEMKDRTGLRSQHVDLISTYPYSIMLPLNRGNSHWTSIAIAITERDGQIEVQIAYSDSLGTGSVPLAVNKEMHRIAALFRKKYGQEQVNITQGVYQYAWRQSDGSSCGPYSLKNAERCLAGKGHEPNPGREHIRKEQLDVMTHGSAIKGCSRSRVIDEVLISWMIDCISRKSSYSISSAEGVERICTQYADSKRVHKNTIRRLFIEEYGLEYGLERGIAEEHLLRHLPVVTRMRELLQKNDLLRKVISSVQYQAELKLLRRVNAMDKIESIREAITKSTEDKINAYGATAEIIDLLARMNVAEAVVKLTGIITEKAEAEPCLLAVAEIIGSRGIEKDYSLKLIGLAKAYHSIHEATTIIKTIESPTDAPKELLEAQITLLQAATRRNDASLLMQVVYVLSDFCSVLTEIITFGWWEPDFRKIEVIEQKLKANHKGVAPADYQTELDSIECLYRSKNRLADEAKKASPLS